MEERAFTDIDAILTMPDFIRCYEEEVIIYSLTIDLELHDLSPKWLKRAPVDKVPEYVMRFCRHNFKDKGLPLPDSITFDGTKVIVSWEFNPALPDGDDAAGLIDEMRILIGLLGLYRYEVRVDADAREYMTKVYLPRLRQCQGGADSATNQ